MDDNLDANIQSESQGSDVCITKSTPPLPSLGKRKASYKTSSSVWDHYTKQIPEGGGKAEKCNCNYCKREFKCLSSQGTSTLTRHLTRCVVYPRHNTDPKQQLLSISNSGQGGDSITNWKFDQEACRKALAYMIIIDEMPFKTVDHDGFQHFCKTLCPLFHLVSRTTITKDCYELYTVEKLKLKKILNEGVQRVCLTTDMWTSNQNIGYMCLTAHYIDMRWRLQKKIINFCMVPSPHTGEVIANSIELCLMGWGIDKLCTLTLDNASANNVGVKNLRRKLTKKNGLLLDGEFFHVRCAAHILNLIVKEGTEEVKEAISRIRNFVRFVRSSPSRQQQFNVCIEQENIQSKSLLQLDVATRWNSTFEMLESALKFQKAFERLEEDSNIVRELKEGPPTEEDWANAASICKFLKTFSEITKRLSGSTYVTASIYFVEVFKIEKLLVEWEKSSDKLFRDMTIRMKEKFDKYWGNIEKVNILLVIATVLDPRYKLKYVKFCYSRFHPMEKVLEIIKKVKDVITELFKVYQLQYPLSGLSSTADESLKDDEVEHIPDLDYELFLETEEVSDCKSELDKYLEETVEKDVPLFDILIWWSSCTKYRTLAHMARDLLAIPVSTVASESAFSTGGRVLDQFRSSLTPSLVESLICAQDWLRSSLKLEIEETWEELQEMEADAMGDASGSRGTNIIK